jgi:hypothetical protein
LLIQSRGGTQEVKKLKLLRQKMHVEKKPNLVRRSDIAAGRDAYGKDKAKEEERRLQELMDEEE